MSGVRHEIFALKGESGRLFKPMDYTNIFAMGAASVLAVTLIPILMVAFITGKIPREERNPLNRWTRLCRWCSGSARLP
jgi:Cu(I)/Ag(I) efflux system membrane protein CusA/SilA